MVRKRRDLAAYHKWWGDAQKLETVQTYMMLGSIRLTAAAMEIPERTIISWRNSAWWQEIVDELRLQDKLQLSQKLKKIVEKSLDITADRLNNGEFRIDNKTGEVVRVPVSLKDAHKVSLDMITKRDDILSTEKVTITDAKIDDKLKTLADKFAEYATRSIENKVKPTIEVTDVIFAEETPSAVYEESKREVG